MRSVLLNTASSMAWITGGLVDRPRGGDFIPFSELIGSSPWAEDAGPSPVTLPIGDIDCSSRSTVPLCRARDPCRGRDGVQDIAVAN